MLLVITRSFYWFRRYCQARNLDYKDGNIKYVNDAYQMQGYPRDTKVVLTTGSQQLDTYTINKARERFDEVVKDYI